MQCSASEVATNKLTRKENEISVVLVVRFYGVVWLCDVLGIVTELCDKSLEIEIKDPRRRTKKRQASKGRKKGRQAKAKKRQASKGAKAGAKASKQTRKGRQAKAQRQARKGAKAGK